MAIVVSILSSECFDSSSGVSRGESLNFSWSLNSSFKMVGERGTVYTILWG